MTNGDRSEPTHGDGVVLPDGGIDPAYRRSLSYIDRSRRYYRAKGFETPYRWATNDDAPFAAMNQPVDRSRVAVVTTAFPSSGAGESKDVQAVAADPAPETMFTNDLFWHKRATDTDDVETFLPLRTLDDLRRAGSIGSLGPRFFSVPTTYSQRTTQRHAAAVEQWCRQDDVEAVLAIPL